MLFVAFHGSALLVVTIANFARINLGSYFREKLMLLKPWGTEFINYVIAFITAGKLLAEVDIELKSVEFLRLVEPVLYFSSV